MKRKWPSPESSVVKVNPGFEVTLTAGSIAASTVVPSRRTTRRAARVVAAGTFSVEPRSVVPPGVTGEHPVDVRLELLGRVGGAALVVGMAAVVVGDEPDPAVLAADVDAALAERRRAVEVVAVGEAGVLRRRVERPAPLAGLGVERVERAVGRADVDDLAVALRRPADHRRGAHRVAGVVAPQLMAVGRDRVDRAVGRADVDRGRVAGGVGGERRRAVDVVGGREGPALGAGRRVERVQRAVERADVDGAVGAERRRGGEIAGGERLPALVASRVEREGVEVDRAPVAVARGVEGRRRPHRVRALGDPALLAVGGERVGAAAGVADVEVRVGPVGDVALPPVDELAGRRLQAGCGRSSGCAWPARAACPSCAAGRASRRRSRS